jgi:uncharacterized membrane protein YhaH (DUF805 family)
MAFCSSCGSKLDEGAKFCANCGARIEEPAARTVIQADQPKSPPQSHVSGIYQQPGPAAGPAQSQNPWQYFCGAMKKYTVFKGRARRAEYWYFVLFYWLLYISCMLVLGFIMTPPVLSTLFILAFLLPSWSVAVRRFHDTGHSAWCVLIPVYGWFIPFFAGTTGPNRFGPDPKQTR